LPRRTSARKKKATVEVVEVLVIVTLVLPALLRAVAVTVALGRDCNAVMSA